MNLRAGRVDTALATLLEDAGRNVERSGVLLRELLVAFPEQATLAEELTACEQEGDRITHDIIYRMGGGRHVRAPFDAGDGYALATAIDDIVDYTEQAAAQLELYGVEAPMEQAVAFADVLVAAGREISGALRRLHGGEELSMHLVEIHRLENEGDRLQRDARGVAVRRRHRPDGGDPLEGHLRVARGRRRRVRDGRARARGDHAQAGAAARLSADARRRRRSGRSRSGRGARRSWRRRLPTRKTWNGAEPPGPTVGQDGPAGRDDLAGAAREHVDDEGSLGDPRVVAHRTGGPAAAGFFARVHARDFELRLRAGTRSARRRRAR